MSQHDPRRAGPGRGRKRVLYGETKRCPKCKSAKPLSEFHMDTEGRPKSYCKKCHSRASHKSASAPEDRPTPIQELGRLVQRVRPDPVEWVAVQYAARCISDYLAAKARGVQHPGGPTAWSVIEAATDDPKRFHQLISVACVQQKLWEVEQRAHVNEQWPKALVSRVRRLKSEKNPPAKIAKALGVEESTVRAILEKLTERAA